MSLLLITPIKQLSGWYPPDKSGLCVWFKADAISGLNDTDPVSTWPDSSGVFAAATQTGSNRPVYKTNQLNGRPVVSFTSSSSQYMSCGNTIAGTWATNAALSLIVVTKNNTLGGSNLFTICNILTNTNKASPTAKIPFVYILLEGTPTYGNSWACFPDLNTTGVNTTATFTSFSTSLINYNGSGVSTAANYAMFKNWSGLTESASGLGTTNSNLSLIGAYASPPATFFYNGDIAEIIGYNSQCDATDITNLTAYILAKYGI